MKVNAERIPTAQLIGIKNPDKEVCQELMSKYSATCGGVVQFFQNF